MCAKPFKRLLVCYVPAIDVRAVEAGAFPFVAELLSSHPSVRFRAQPTTDQLATLFTGTYPHQHGLWGPRLKPDWCQRTLPQRMVDLLPDIATTSGQCALHVLGGPIDLATMPPRRHRRFDWLRFNIKQTDDVARALQPINDLPSLHTVVGEGRSRFLYHDNYWDLERLLDTVGNGEHTLEMVDVHCLDHLQHWSMGDAQRIEAFFLGVDRFVAALHDKSRRHGIGFVLLSDHGMEPVDRVVDLRKILKVLDLPGNAYDVFIENTKATFWFHDASAAAAIKHALRSSGSGELLEREDMRRYNLMFEHRRYGDAFWYAAPGSTLFPNDFHQPLASLVRTVADRQQRQRWRKPWHQADHGYLSESDCEIGFMVLAEDGFAAIGDGEVALIDIAPTLLDLLDLPKPDTMQGHVTLRRR